MKFTTAHLKKELSRKTKEEIIQQISTLCQLFPQVKEYYQAQTDDTDEILKKYKDIIEKEFIEGKGRGLPTARLSVGKKSVSDFKKLIQDPNMIADVMFTYVESVSSFCSEFEPNTEEYYISAENMFEQVLVLLQKNGIEDSFEQRAYKIVKNATDSYGHLDSLKERYEEIYGDFKTIQSTNH